MGNCYFCGEEITASEKIYRSSTCPVCGKDLKICLNCRFYTPGSHWDCLETISEPVRDKESANFCDFFSFSGQGARKEKNKKENPRSNFEKLFQDE